MAELLAITTLHSGPPPRGRYSPVRGLAWCLGALAWTAAALVGAVLALVLTVTVVVIAAMSWLLVGLAASAVKARRALDRHGSGPLIEARRVGGHSWVAYGWDGNLEPNL